MWSIQKVAPGYQNIVKDNKRQATKAVLGCEYSLTMSFFLFTHSWLTQSHTCFNCSEVCRIYCWGKNPWIANTELLWQWAHVNLELNNVSVRVGVVCPAEVKLWSIKENFSSDPQAQCLLHRSENYCGSESTKWGHWSKLCPGLTRQQADKHQSTVQEVQKQALTLLYVRPVQDLQALRCFWIWLEILVTSTFDASLQIHNFEDICIRALSLVLLSGPLIHYSRVTSDTSGSLFLPAEREPLVIHVLLSMT